MIHDMNHFTVLTDDLDRTLAFYGRLGLRPGPRPPRSVSARRRSSGWLPAERFSG